MQPLHALSGMAKQVAKAIFKRVSFPAPASRNEKRMLISSSEHTISRLRDITHTRKKVVVFDMDNTLLRGSFIRAAAEKFNFREDLDHIAATETDPIIRTKKIARLLKGKTFGELIQTVQTIPLIHDAVHVVQELKRRGYVCGIVSDSYQCITNYVRNIVGMDFALGNELVFNNSVATGAVKIPAEFLNGDASHCDHRHCKSNVLISLLSKIGITNADIVAVGDGENDVCMIRFAGVGVALNPTWSLLPEVSDHVFQTRSLKPVLNVIG
jgi:glucosyl-3-phosphoglycerate synthase